jgi:hypothetical protein
LTVPRVTGDDLPQHNLGTGGVWLEPVMANEQQLQ